MTEQPCYQVRWTEAAVRDLEEIVDFVAREAPNNARRLLHRLQTRAASLESIPFRGRIVPELRHFGMRTWRELIVKPHRLVYRVGDETVLVLAVLDGRRDLEDLLLERLLRG